jgi:hypothetical protein
MRKMVLLATMMALAALMLAAAPASAQDFDGFCEDFDGFVICDFDEFCEDLDGDFFCDEDDFFGEGGEQEAESGDVDQTFVVSGPDDNSNQTVGIQGVANTGNVQNAFGFNDGFGDDFGDEFFCDEDNDGFCDDVFFDEDFFFDGNGDVEFEDGGASIEVSPTQVVTSDQQVNQAAAASAFWPWWWK